MTRLNSQHARWWTPERRAEAAARSHEAWRARNPERAAVRDRLLSENQPEPCDQCAGPDVVLWVVDYAIPSWVWRCRPCAERMQGATRGAGPIAAAEGDRQGPPEAEYTHGQFATPKYSGGR